MVGLTIEIKLSFRDGLVWTEGLTVEIKLGGRSGQIASSVTLALQFISNRALTWGC